MFPLGAKPIRYGPRIDDYETQLLALGNTIAQQDKFDGDNEATGSVKSNDDSNTLLDNLDEEWTFTSRTSPSPPAGSEDSETSNPVDYSPEDETESVKAFDNNEMGSVKASDDNQDNIPAGDNQDNQDNLVKTPRPLRR